MEISINLVEFSLNSRVFFAKLKKFFAKLKEFFAKLNFSAIRGTRDGGKTLKKQACIIGGGQGKATKNDK